LLRAWESRYGAIRPLRTAGGSRRYSEDDLHRLSLLRDAVAAGNRIGGIAQLGLSELKGLLPVELDRESPPIDQIIALAKKFDGAETRRLLSQLIGELGAAEFAKEIALPLLVEVGERWHRGDLSISVEHFMTGIVRSFLIPALGSLDAEPSAPRMVFATPSGERHDLGSLFAALIAARAGADAVFLGADVPVEELIESVARSRATVLVLGFVTLPKEESERAIREVRAGLSKEVSVWIGGAGVDGIPPVKDTLRVVNLEQVEAQATLLVGLVQDHSSTGDIRRTQ
jgi:methanogenic corrinoid protein MtbC1